MKKFTQIALSVLISFSTFFALSTDLKASERTPYSDHKSVISFVSNNKVVTGKLNEKKSTWKNLVTSTESVIGNAMFYDVIVKGKTRLYQTFANKKGFLVTKFTLDGLNWTSPIVDKTQKVTSNYKIFQGCGEYIMTFRDTSTNQIYLRYSSNGRKWSEWEQNGKGVLDLSFIQETFFKENDPNPYYNCMMNTVGVTGANDMYFRIKENGVAEWSKWRREINDFAPATELVTYSIIDENEHQLENNGVYMVTTDTSGRIYFRKTVNKIGSDYVDGNYEWTDWIQTGRAAVGESVHVSKENTNLCFVKTADNTVFSRDCSNFGLENDEWVVYYFLPVKLVSVFRNPTTNTDFFGVVNFDNTISYQICNNYCTPQNEVRNVNGYSNVTDLSFYISAIGIK